jgi:hypothetical protein
MTMDQTHDRFEIIDAFVDGELVDPGALKQALSEEAGRDHLVDAWLLRDAVQDELAADAPMPMPRPAARPRRPWALAAAVACVSLISGYFVGVNLPNAFQTPADTGATTTAGERQKSGVKPADINVPATSFPVPAPTRVIRLELDGNWREAGGGE